MSLSTEATAKIVSEFGRDANDTVLPMFRLLC